MGGGGGFMIVDYQVNLNETNFVYALLVTVVGVSP